jgi:small subunit ribosomal protein S6
MDHDDMRDDDGPVRRDVVEAPPITEEDTEVAAAFAASALLEQLRGSRVYELFLLYDPAVAQKDWDALIEFLRELVTKNGGVLLKTPEMWGENRKLAYEIAGQRRGSYVVAYFRGMPGSIIEMERTLKLDERVMRHMVINHGTELPAAARLKAVARVREA